MSMNTKLTNMNIADLTREEITAHCKKCWETLEWYGWPDLRSMRLVDEMATYWKHLPEEHRRPYFGSPLAPALKRAWTLAMESVDNEVLAD